MEWERQGWDPDAIIDKTLGWHISSFNPKSMPIPKNWQKKIEAWIAKMGYHFTLHTVEADVKDGKLGPRVYLATDAPESGDLYTVGTIEI